MPPRFKVGLTLIALIAGGTRPVAAQPDPPPTAGLPVTGIESLAAPPTGGADPTAGGANAKSDGGKKSLIEQKPVLFTTALRYRKFYGDAYTATGSLLDRSYLTGDWGGVRDRLIDNGLYTYIGMTQFAEGNVAGGLRRAPRGNGSLDYSLWYDTGKADLWSGGAFFLHGETGWGLNRNGDTGALVPANYDAARPEKAGPRTALSEFYYIQALTPRLIAAAGKMDLSAWADQNLFANNWRFQFQYAGLVNNPQIGAIVPYTTWANWYCFFPAPDTRIILTMNSVNGSATSGDFNRIYDGNTTYSLFVSHSPVIAGRPGLYQLIVGYASNKPASFQVDPDFDPNALLSGVPTRRADGNYGVVGSASQYLWTARDGRTSYGSPLGVGVFGRFGITPADRNVIEKFFSAGVGGFGGPFGRDNDNWGIGWAGSRISNDLRVALAGTRSLRQWEHAAEAFYNFQVTPATFLTLSTQVIDPVRQDVGTVVGLGTRLQVDF